MIGLAVVHSLSASSNFNEKCQILTFPLAPVTLTFRGDHPKVHVLKGLVPHYTHAKLQVSNVHSLREKSNVKVLHGQTDRQTDRRGRVST